MTGRLLAVSRGDGYGAFRGNHVATGENTFRTGHQVFIHLDHSVPGHRNTRNAFEHAGIDILPQREHQAVRFQGLDLAGRLWAAVLVDLHHLHLEGGAVDFADGAQPVDLDALGFSLDRFEIVGRHMLPVTAVDDHGLFSAHALGGARRIHCRVTAAINGHAAAQFRHFAFFHRCQVADRVQDSA